MTRAFAVAEDAVVVALELVSFSVEANHVVRISADLRGVMASCTERGVGIVQELPCKLFKLRVPLHERFGVNHWLRLRLSHSSLGIPEKCAP